MPAGSMIATFSRLHVRRQAQQEIASMISRIGIMIAAACTGGALIAISGMASTARLPPNPPLPMAIRKTAGTARA